MKKQNPDHYLKTQGRHSGDQDVYFDGIQRNLEQHAQDFAGALITYSWWSIVYEPQRIVQHLDWLHSRGKFLLACIEHKSYWGENDFSQLVPSYIPLSRHKNGYIADLWSPSVMDDYLADMANFATSLDDYYALEQVSFIPESSPAFGSNPPAGYSHEKYANQIMHVYDRAAEVFKQTVFTGGVNNLGNLEGTLIAKLFLNRQGRAGPDAHAVDGYREVVDGGYAGKMPHRVIVSAPNLGGGDNILPLSKVQKHLDDGKVTHAAWVVTSPYEGGTKADIVNWIKDHPTYQEIPDNLIDDEPEPEPEPDYQAQIAELTAELNAAAAEYKARIAAQDAELDSAHMEIHLLKARIEAARELLA